MLSKARIITLPNVIVTCHTAANSDESYIDCQTHAAREVANALSGKDLPTEIKDPWVWAEAQGKGFGEVYIFRRVILTHSRRPVSF